MSARGAADFLTRTTAILATGFVVLSIALAFVAAREGGPTQINEAATKTAPAAKTETMPVVAPGADKAAPAADKAPEAPLDK
jgi:preprotein translocase subunit SecG